VRDTFLMLDVPADVWTVSDRNKNNKPDRKE